MGKFIRRTLTITITESWTIVWTLDDPPPRHPTTNGQDRPETQEEPDENLQATITTTELDKPSVSDPTATPLTPAAALELPSGRASAYATTSRKRKRSRGRRVEGKQRNL